jgi:uroporphyrinogen-III synthase
MARPRVLVTRSPHQASALADQLRTLDAEPVLIPTIQLADPSSFAALDDALAEAATFHWLVFTSANAVEAFARRGGVQRVSAQKIAVIGAATARALEAFGIHADLVPSRAVAESLAEALLPFAWQQNGHAARFLLVRAEVAREILPKALRAAGAEVVIAPAYRTVVAEGSVAAIREIFEVRERWPDAVCFTSSSSVTNLLALLEVSSLNLPEEVLRISIGPITSQTLRDEGLFPHAEAAEATLPALAAAVIQAVALRKSH